MRAPGVLPLFWCCPLLLTCERPTTPDARGSRPAPVSTSGLGTLGDGAKRPIHGGDEFEPEANLRPERGLLRKAPRMRALISGSRSFPIPASVHQPRLQRTAWLVVLAAAFNLALLVTAAALLVASAVALLAGCDPRTDATAGKLERRNEAASSHPNDRPDVARAQPATTPSDVDTLRAPAASAAATAGLAAEEELATTHVCSLAGVLDVRKVDENRFEVSRGNLKAAVDAVQQKAAARDGALSAATSASGRRGLRVEEVGSRAACGVAPGDILIAVDGIAVSDSKRLAAHRLVLPESDRVELQVERAGEVRLLVYSIKD